uniref:Uncharacterized protein n=1 Tax=Setaria digitata TaxID=48799 RepID=A0A915Q886_9BILA
MGERYKRWLEIFKQLNEHSPTREEIELIAPPHIKEEYYELHPPKKTIQKPMPKVKLKRSFDKRDCLPEPVLKKSRVDVSAASGSKMGAELPLRRSPRKHISSSFVRPISPKKTDSLKPLTHRSYTNLFKLDDFQVKRPSSNFIIPEGESSTDSVQAQPDEQILRRSPRKHPSSCHEVLLSPRKPLLLSQPIVCRRLSSLLGSLSDFESEKESLSLNGSFETAAVEENKENPEENLKKLSDRCDEDTEQQPFLDEKQSLKRKVRGKNDNYRRLKMKKCYVRSASLAKKNFRKWRKTRNKR